jgi:aromatic ring-opening dioxygenase catalytic subunit (LigB family)
MKMVMSMLHQSLHEEIGSRMSQIIVVGACWHPNFWVNIMCTQTNEVVHAYSSFVHAQVVA